MGSIIATIALVAIGIGIAGAIFVMRPDYLDSILPSFPQVSVTNLVNERIDISSGRAQSYEIFTGDSKAILLVIYPQNSDAKVAVNVSYPDGQNKTFAGKEQLNYIVDFNTPLNIEITPEQDSRVLVDLQPFSHSNLNVKISLKYIR